MSWGFNMTPKSDKYLFFFANMIKSNLLVEIPTFARSYSTSFFSFSFLGNHIPTQDDIKNKKDQSFVIKISAFKVKGNRCAHHMHASFWWWWIQIVHFVDLNTHHSQRKIQLLTRNHFTVSFSFFLFSREMLFDHTLTGIQFTWSFD